MTVRRVMLSPEFAVGVDHDVLRITLLRGARCWGVPLRVEAELLYEPLLRIAPPQRNRRQCSRIVNRYNKLRNGSLAL
jgi:hypothetical protein